MKKLTLLKSLVFSSCMLLLLALAVASCTKGVDEDTSAPEPDGNVWTTHEDVIAAMGFDVSTLIKFDGGCVVEGDIFFSDEQLDGYLQAGPATRHLSYYPGPLMSRDRARNIKVYVDTDIRGVVEKYVKLAINQWNLALTGTIIKLEYVTTTPYDIRFRKGGELVTETTMSYHNIMYLANIPYPYPVEYGTPGPGNSVATNATLIGGTPIKTPPATGQIMYQTVQALGHCMGLAHTDGCDGHPIIFPGSYIETYKPDYYNIIPGVVSDPASVMNYNGGAWTEYAGISYYDRLAMKYLYPGLRGINPVWSNQYPMVGEIVNVSIPISDLHDLRSVNWLAASQNISILSGQGTPNLSFKVTGTGNIKLHTTAEFSAFLLTDTMTCIATVNPAQLPALERPAILNITMGDNIKAGDWFAYDAHFLIPQQAQVLWGNFQCRWIVPDLPTGTLEYTTTVIPPNQYQFWGYSCIISGQFFSPGQYSLVFEAESIKFPGIKFTSAPKIITITP